MEGECTVDAVESEGILLGGIGAGSQHIAGIEEDRTGHDGIEVDHGERLTAILPEEDVVHLRIVVGDAYRQPAC